MLGKTIVVPEKVLTYLRLMRVNQWTKNLVIFVAIIFSGKLFDGQLFLKSLAAFAIFCALSSASYIVNDIIDAPSDAKHPAKKLRPIASGAIRLEQAIVLTVILCTFGFLLALLFDKNLFFLTLLFLALQFLYSFFLKSYAVVDLFAISASFAIRAFAGKVATGFHVPVWLLLTIFFLSLFVASIKRSAELMSAGLDARHTLRKYNKHFLDFLTYTFSTSAIVTYSLYSYIEQPPSVVTPFSQVIASLFPGTEGRKLMTLTIPIMVYAMARYGQLFYTRTQGERPEKIFITDGPLIATIITWGIMVIAFIYLL